MESWRRVFRNGFAPALSSDALGALRQALLRDDARLIQGATTSPPPLQCVQAWEVEGACLIGYGGWQGEGLKTVAEVEEYFARLCNKADRLIGEPAACRYLLNFFDETPRAEMRRSLLPEVQRELAQRANVATEQAASV